MAIRPDYDIGTVTLTSGSSDFTTSGSSLQTAAVQAGDAIIAPSGHVLIIASITGQNSGTLFLPCPAAAAGSGLPLRIRFQPDGSRYQGAVRNLIELLASGNLEAFAALVGANGMVPIFTGPGTLDLADPATFGIQDPNGSLGKLAALTLAARQILQTDAAGDLKQIALAANKFLRTDANGDIAQSDIAAWAISMLGLVGAANKFPYLNDANTAALADITALGRAFLALTGTNGNIPVMTGAGTVASRPIVGTVSQSGGVPTGAIVEVGGDITSGYMRLAGGVQICWRTNQTGIPNTNVAAGSIFAGTSYSLGNFAAAFASIPAVICGGTGSSGGGWIAQEIYHTATSWGSFSARSAGNTGIQVQFFALAIGKYY